MNKECSTNLPPPQHTHFVFSLLSIYSFNFCCADYSESLVSASLLEVFCVEGIGVHCFRTNLGTMFIEFSYSQSNSGDYVVLPLNTGQGGTNILSILHFKLTPSFFLIYWSMMLNFFKAMKSVSYLDSFCESRYITLINQYQQITLNIQENCMLTLVRDF